MLSTLHAPPPYPPPSPPRRRRRKTTHFSLEALPFPWPLPPSSPLASSRSNEPFALTAFALHTPPYAAAKTCAVSAASQLPSVPEVVPEFHAAGSRRHSSSPSHKHDQTNGRNHEHEQKHEPNFAKGKDIEPVYAPLPRGSDFAAVPSPPLTPSFPSPVAVPPRSSSRPASIAASPALVSVPASASAPTRRRGRAAAHESFLDTKPTVVDVAASMADNRTARTPQRDSHDLSLSPRDVTRDSLVTNMLLSLDQLSFGQGHGSNGAPGDSFAAGGPLGYGAGPNDDDSSHGYQSRPWTKDSSASASSPSRYDVAAGRRYRHKTSFSSDMDSIVPDDPGRAITTSGSGHHSRHNRSNSSSNFYTQGQSARSNNGRDLSGKQQPTTPTKSASNAQTRHGRHSTKSSSSASVDLGHPQALVSQRLAQTLGRSASFDYDRPQTQSHGLPQSQSQQPFSPFQVEFPETFPRDEYAAPTPTIPAGPRREGSGLPLPPPPPPPKEHRTLERQRSTSRSLKSSSGRSRRGTAHQTSPPPPMPPVDLDSAPAPNVGYGKSKESEPPASAAATQPKERPGFFRRVFGSSKNSSAANSTNNLTGLSHSASRLAVSQEHTKHQIPTSATSQAKLSSVPPSRDTSSSHSNHPTLQKKSSSFFRRRKKSFADEAPAMPGSEDRPPVPPLDHVNLRSAAKDENSSSGANNKVSPTSSLRQVMNPYLKQRESATGLGLTGVSVPAPLSDITTSTPERIDREENSDRYQREFSPDYEPSPNAVIRKVKPEFDGPRYEDPTTPSRQPTKRQDKEMPTTSNSFLDLDGGSDQDDGVPAVNGMRKGSNSEDRDATIRAKKKRPTIDMQEEHHPQAQSALALPTDGGRSASLASGSTGTGYKTAPSVPPSVQVEEASGGEPSPKVLGTLKTMKSCKSLDEPEFVVGEPTEDDRQKAQDIYNGIEEFIQKDKAAAWMGEQGPVRQRTLQAYMELYDFSGQSILSALRQVCGRLVLRAETQQVDRILVAFSKRWCSCNPNHGFKATDVIHMICYSIMLLNTDLHLADIEQKMTRSQFIKNTMTTITQAVIESAPSAFVRPSILPGKNSALGTEASRQPADSDRSANRASVRPPPRTDSNDVEDCGPLVKAPFNGPMRAWQEQVEIVLKSIYASIRDERLPLFGADSERRPSIPPSQSSLSVKGMLKRSPSALSKTPSETGLSTRGRIADTGRTSASRWTSKSRSRPPPVGRNGFSSSRTSFDDGSSIWSPAMSSATWSKHSLGRTQGSMSQDSFASAMPRGDYQQSIGFANALSQAIIRDEDANGAEGAPSLMSADLNEAQFLEDESLELAGPPWVKEGMVMHKHHLDGVGKRAKDRNWTEVFAVVQKGQMSIFSFNASKSMRQKSRAKNMSRPTGPVGGGNWQDNALCLGNFNLRLTLASALPSPGYSRSRPHVWALSLPTGAVHLFQVGTSEIIREFVNTANYWSARLSTHPMIGGISNIEYGWSEAVVNNALVTAINDARSVGGGRSSRPGSSAAHHARKSSAASSSFRGSSLDHAAAVFTNNSGRGKLPGDRIHIAEWAPPTQSFRPSVASETEQLEALGAYVKGIEDELQAHNQLRNPMLLAFTPRGHNAGKAMANWERKSAYLLREIVKFRTYVDCLQQAEGRKKEIYRERDLAQKAARGELSDVDAGITDNDEADETLKP